MANLNTNIIGLTFNWRRAKNHDALRVFVYQNKEYIAISAKAYPTLKQINKHLVAKQFTKDQAIQDEQFQVLFQRILTSWEFLYHFINLHFAHQIFSEV